MSSGFDSVYLYSQTFPFSGWHSFLLGDFVCLLGMFRHWASSVFVIAISVSDFGVGFGTVIRY